MTNRRAVHLVCLLYCCATLNGDGAHGDQKDLNKKASAPNIILFLADDLGWGDLAVFGHPTQEEGPIDQMAKEGIRFTQWYAAGSMCTPSRASLLTGVHSLSANAEVSCVLTPYDYYLKSYFFN